MKNYFKVLIILTLQNLFIINTIYSISHNNRKCDDNYILESEIRKIYNAFYKVNINQIDERINGRRLFTNKKIISTINIGFNKYNGNPKEHNFNKISFWNNKKIYS